MFDKRITNFVKTCTHSILRRLDAHHADLETWLALIADQQADRIAAHFQAQLEARIRQGEKLTNVQLAALVKDAVLAQK